MATISRAFGYTRVSTPGQAEHGHSLEEQRERIAEWCDQQGIELLGIYEEGGVSGSNGIETREALPELFGDLDETEGVDAVVIVKLDRLARDLMVQETIIGDLRRRGIELISIAEPDLGSDDPTRTLIRQVMGAVAEYDRKMVVARLGMGRRRKRRQGGYSGGWLPLGYRVEGDGQEATVEIDEAEATIVRRIYREYAGGRSATSMRAIAQGLTADGVATRRGGTWAQGTIAAILDNEAYTGATGLPEIIERRTWEIAQGRRARRQRTRRDEE